MKIVLLCVGKTDFNFVEEGVKLYSERLKHYCQFEILCIPALKNVSSLTKEQIKEREGDLIIKELSKRDGHVVLLDERGKLYDSVEWAKSIERVLSGIKTSAKNLVFVIGGAYGFSESVYKIARESLSLSKMTFSHQIVRVIFLEQLYRAFTIIKGEPYHHI